MHSTVADGQNTQSVTGLQERGHHERQSKKRRKLTNELG